MTARRIMVPRIGCKGLAEALPEPRLRQYAAEQRGTKVPLTGVASAAYLRWAAEPCSSVAYL
jgi:hypothetical protein